MENSESPIFAISLVLEGQNYSQKKGMCWLVQEFQTGLKRNGSKLKETRENTFFQKSTFIFQLTYIPFCHFRYLYKGGINVI